MKQNKNPERKWKKELKALKKQNKNLYIIAKKSVSRREINNIRSKSSKKRRDDSSDSSSDKLNYDSSLFRHSD